MIQAASQNARTQWYHPPAPAELSFPKSRRLSGSGTRQQIFFCLPALAGGGGREDRRLSSPKSYPQRVSGLGDTTSRGGIFFRRLVAMSVIPSRIRRRGTSL